MKKVNINQKINQMESGHTPQRTDSYWFQIFLFKFVWINNLN